MSHWKRGKTVLKARCRFSNIQHSHRPGRKGQPGIEAFQEVRKYFQLWTNCHVINCHCLGHCHISQISSTSSISFSETKQRDTFPSFVCAKVRNAKLTSLAETSWDINDPTDPNPTGEPRDTIAVMPRALCWAVQVPQVVQLHDPHKVCNLESRWAKRKWKSINACTALRNLPLPLLLPLPAQLHAGLPPPSAGTFDIYQELSKRPVQNLCAWHVS